jgi:hypothetical protein
MPDTYTPLAPAPQDAASHSRSPFLIAGIIVAVLVAIAAVGYALYAYSPFGPWMQGAWSIMTMPNELKGATFVSDGATGTTLYRIHGLSFVPEAVDGMLISAQQQGNSRADIVHTGAKYALMVDGKEAYASSSPLLGVTRTPDGTRAVVSAQTSHKEDLPTPVYLPGPTIHPYLWTDFLLHLDGNGSPLAIGNGSASLYLDATHIVRVAPVGIVSVDMTNGHSSVLVSQAVPTTIASVLASPDRMHLGWYDPAAHSVIVYHVTPDTADQPNTLPIAGTITSYALGNDALFIVRTSASAIARQSFTGSAPAKVVAHLPADLHITRLLLGSL